MYVAINGSGNSKALYIMASYRKNNGKTSSRVVRKLGRFNELLSKFDNDEEKLMKWARSEAKKDTELHVSPEFKISIPFSNTKRIDKNEEVLFNSGYLFLQSLCSQLHIDNICRNMKSRHNFEYPIRSIFLDLIYSRILHPSSKKSSFDFAHTLLEQPKYDIHHVYRALSVLAQESDYIQSEIYRNSNFIHSRNTKILYYDCTNYYFEIEDGDSLRKYGKSKEHRPNPIVTMGLFMDSDGIPLAFDIYPGNQNEQKTLKPLEQKIIRDFDCSEFIYCSDAGLGSQNNKLFNDIQGRSYIITQSLKKLKKEDREIALNPTQFKRLGSHEWVDISTLDEDDPDIYHSIYYKEVPIESKKLSETLIVTYSPKYRAYQEKIRQKQIDRALKAINSKEKVKQERRNPNDPFRLVKKTFITTNGEVAEQKIYELNQELIEQEMMYDGFYAITTDMEGSVEQIIKINQHRWQIEECFRIMKTEFEARPVYLQREDRIKAHFLICFLALLVYRLLEQKLEKRYTAEQIISTLRGMYVTRLKKEYGYIPSYKRTDLTDKLHELFDFETDREIISKSTMRNIIKKTKEKTI